MLSDRSVTKHADACNLKLKDEYWRLMEELDPVLKALAMATTASCGEEAVQWSTRWCAVVMTKVVMKKSRLL